MSETIERNATVATAARGTIALQCGLEESVAGDRLIELREQGHADYTRVGRDVTWHAVEEAA